VSYRLLLFYAGVLCPLFYNTCGAKYSTDKALLMSKTTAKKAPHRHVVFTIPEKLRPYFAKNCALLNIDLTLTINTFLK